jgi:hypothetical protein
MTLHPKQALAIDLIDSLQADYKKSEDLICGQLKFLVD